MAQDNIIKVKFQSDGDKGLIKAIEKLDAVHKKLTKAQENLIDVGKKGGRANVNAINTLRRYNARLKENNLTLKDLNIKPNDVEQGMSKWLWRFRDGGEFAKL